MSGLAYLKDNGLYAELVHDKQVRVKPTRNITTEIRVWIKEHKAQLLRELTPVGGFNSWHIRVNGKAMTMLSPCRTCDEVAASVRDRWPNAQVEVM